MGRRALRRLCGCMGALFCEGESQRSLRLLGLELACCWRAATCPPRLKYPPADCCCMYGCGVTAAAFLSFGSGGNHGGKGRPFSV